MIRDDLQKFDLPDSPGVYFFLGTPKRRGGGKKILYIGKAASLSDRVRSYFSPDLVQGRGERIVGMVAEATALEWLETSSVLEALILEANLIKKHQPPYNVDEKDNKSFNYLVLTKEKFPRVLVVRGRELFLKWDEKDMKYLFGPFPSGGALKEAVKIVRKIFPFRDTCVPGSGKPCFNRQIGLCPGVCSGEVGEKEYATIVAHIKELFSGNFQGLKRSLVKEMKAASAAEQFEDAETLRRQIAALEHVRDVSLIKDEYRASSGGAHSGVRIEAYDVAHTSGSETVAVMTVVEDGAAAKGEYRKFKIATVENNDVAALVEALSRRLAHTEWRMPRVVVVDGGAAQLRAAEKVLQGAGMQVPIVGVVKDEHHKPVRLIGDARAASLYERSILLANAEAHRFAIGWHRERRGRRSMNA